MITGRTYETVQITHKAEAQKRDGIIQKWLYPIWPLRIGVRAKSGKCIPASYDTITSDNFCDTASAAWTRPGDVYALCPVKHHRAVITKRHWVTATLVQSPSDAECPLFLGCAC